MEDVSQILWLFHAKRNLLAAVSFIVLVEYSCCIAILKLISNLLIANLCNFLNSLNMLGRFLLQKPWTQNIDMPMVNGANITLLHYTPLAPSEDR